MINTRVYWSIFIIIFIIATYIRIDFINSVEHTIPHDTVHYDIMVRQLLEENIYGYKSEEPNALVTPGYPLFMAAIYKIVDYNVNDPFDYIRYIQVILSLLSMYMIFHLTKKAGGYYAGLIAMFVAAIYPPFIWANGAILTEVLATFFLLSYLCLQIKTFETKSRILAFIAGILFGLVTITRSEFALILIVLYVFWFLLKRDYTLIRLLVISVAGFIVVMLPWWIRNIFILQEFVLLSAQTNPFFAGTFPHRNYGCELVCIEGKTEMEAALERLKVGFTQDTWTFIYWYTIGKLIYIYLPMYLGAGHSPHYNVIPFAGAFHLMIVCFGVISIIITFIIKKHVYLMMFSVIIIVMSLIRLLFVPEARYNFTVMPLFIIINSVIAYNIITLYWAKFNKKTTLSKMKRCFILLVIMLTVCLGLFYLSRDLQPKPLIMEPPQKPVVIANNYDLIVVGSEPEGIAAAISGARNGLSTLLVDTHPVLGGSITLGWWLNTIDMNYCPNGEMLNRGIFMNYCPNGEMLNRGIFLEFFEQVEGNFDVYTALNAFNRLVENEQNISVLLGVDNIEPLIDKRDGEITIKGIRVTEQASGVREFTAPVVIDATQDADIAAASGAMYSMPFEDIGYKERYAAVTLVFKLSGVSYLDWYRMKVNLIVDRLAGDRAGVSRNSAWGFGNAMAKYQPTNEQVGVGRLNISRQKDGTLLVNALHVYGINPLDKQQLAKARQLAEAELPHVIAFLQNIRGLENAKLVAVAPELYVRMSRQIYTEYRLTVNDVLENRDFPDAIAYGSHPVYNQAVDRCSLGTVVGDPIKYAIPFRSLVPLKINNLLVVGRSAGFDSLAQSSARAISVGMATGQAAGVAAAISIENDVNMRELSNNQELISELQQRLNAQGMKIEPFEYTAPETKHWSYEGLKFIRRYGLAYGGYKNEYYLDKEMTEEQFINMLSALTKLAGSEDLSRPKLFVEGNELTIDDIAYMFTRYQGMELNQKQAYQHLVNENFFDVAIIEKIKENDGVITRGAAYMLMKDFITYTSGED